MTSPLQIITRSLQTLNQLGEGERPTATQANDGLVYFNDLIQSWSNQNLLVNALTNVPVPMTGASTYTVGVAGDVNVARPIHISGAFYRDALNNDYPVQLVTREEYNAIQVKAQTSTVPYAAFVVYTYPLLILYAYPVASTGTIFLACVNQLMGAAALSDELILPDGYERALRFSLAAEMQSEYGISNDSIVRTAASAVAQLKRTNHRTRKLNAGTVTKPNVLTGYY